MPRRVPSPITLCEKKKKRSIVTYRPPSSREVLVVYDLPHVTLIKYYYSQDFVQTQQNFAQLHDCTTVTLRSSGSKYIVPNL